MKSPATPTKPVVQNDTDSYNVAFSLQERLTNANKSSSSLRSLNQRNGRSTPNLLQGSDTNSILIHTEDDGSYFINYYTEIFVFFFLQKLKLSLKY